MLHPQIISVLLPSSFLCIGPQSLLGCTSVHPCISSFLISWFFSFLPYVTCCLLWVHVWGRRCKFWNTRCREKRTSWPFWVIPKNILIITIFCEAIKEKKNIREAISYWNAHLGKPWISIEVYSVLKRVLIKLVFMLSVCFICLQQYLPDLRI